MGRTDGAAALVRDISPQLVEGELTYLSRRPVDLEVARAQHATYVQLLRDTGRQIVHAPAAPAHPDGVFVEDVLVMVGDLAIITRPGSASRRGEVEGLAGVLEARGLEVAALTAPATLDGGDVLQVDDTIYVGRSTRTNGPGIEQLRRLVAPTGRTVVPVDFQNALHLKSAVTALPDGRLVANPDCVTAAAFPSRDLVEVLEPLGADVLLLDDTVVISHSAPRTAAMLRAEGYVIQTIDIGELEKVEAGPTCPSVLLPPPW